MENNIKQWLQDWINQTSETKYENGWKEVSDEWTEIKSIGMRFKGIEIIQEGQTTDHEINFTIRYDKYEKLK
jgi:hypothetical protein